uniref:IPT/TIG domain-containing protein n=1 Tax=Hemiselmis andersenii TaxID=464988 RepID=A0A6U4UG80_HEMAN|mmetsp:Transcript_3634/g.8347  ORF Transcript_3634/g.8347 Transcript_3634/m.8347 type:complete len:1553 (+) Transcript_3634:81-4739(+)
MAFRLLPLLITLLLPAYSAAAGAAAWSDTSVLAATTFHGPDLAFKGDLGSSTTGVDDGTFVIGSSIIAKSVMTGSDSFFPSTLPAALKVPHLVPDSTHPDLAFWWTPEAFERDGVADGASISEWPNVANICHDKHVERVGGGANDICVAAKIQNSQTVSGGNTVNVARMGQNDATKRPIYKKKIANGHGVVRFTRTAVDGTAGPFLELDQRCSDSACGTASTTEGWAADTVYNTAIGASGMTIITVVKMMQSATDRNNMGIVHLNANAADKNGFGLYATESKCMPKHYGVFTQALQTSGLTTQILDGTNLALVRLDVSSTPSASTIVNAYSGMTLKVFGNAADANTGEQTLSHTCTLDKYLFQGTLTATFASGVNVVTILGGSGSINGMSHADISNLFLSFGCTDPNDCTTGGPATEILQIASIANNAGNTDITLGSNLANNQALGTSVFVCLESDGTKCIIASTSGACDVTTAPAADGTFEIWDTSDTGAPNCPRGRVKQFGTFNAYLNNVNDNNGCQSECATATQVGCNRQTADFGSGTTCADKQGTLHKMTDANEGFKIIAVTIPAARTSFKGYVNGFHEGCDYRQGTDGCAANKIIPPLLATGATAATAFARMKLGSLSVANAAPVTGLASMDMAEMMVYSQELTPEELDRIGNYLANKYGIDDYIVNDDIRSPFRTKPVSLSTGCGPTHRKLHEGIICKGLGHNTCYHSTANSPPTGANLKHDTISLQSTLAENVANYYLLARMTITGGNGNLAGTVKSAKGQSCVITAYAATTYLATCDFTNQGDFGYVKYAGDSTGVTYITGWQNQATNAVEANAAHNVLYTTYAPANYVAPFVALLGDPTTANIEAVRVTAKAIEGTDFKLTATRGVGGTTLQALTNAASILHGNTAKLTYCHAIIMGDAVVGDTFLIVSALGTLYDLPTTTGITNWFAKIVLPNSGGTEVVQVTAANAPTFLTNAIVANGATTLVLKDNTQTLTFSILDGDQLTIGDLSTGETVTVSGDVAKAGLTWTLTISAIVAAGGFAADVQVTLVNRKSVPSPTVITVVRAQEATTALALTATAGISVDFMYLPQNQFSTGALWTGGDGVSTYRIEDCDTWAYPYSRDAPIQTFTGNGYIKGPPSTFGLGISTSDTLTTGNSLWYSAGAGDSSTSLAVGPAGGGQMVVIKGWHLMPHDTHIRYGVSANTPTGTLDVQRLENFLRVTVGQRPAECRDPTNRAAPCLAGTNSHGETALNCQIVETGAGYCATDFRVPCRCVGGSCSDCPSTGACNYIGTTETSAANYALKKNVWHQTRKPTIHCSVPPALGADMQDLNIYWHGVKTSLTNWYRPEAPVISRIEPAMAAYAGGETVTIIGRNFGPKIAYTSISAGGAATAGTRQSHVEVRGKSFSAKCATTTYVSDTQLLCVVPTLPARKIAGLDKTTRKVEVSVVVSAEGLRSALTSQSILTYTGVPSYFSCEYKSTSEAAKRDCFTCCRSACIIDEFALGGVKGGSTFSHCDASCYSYCGYSSVSRRRLLSEREGRRTSARAKRIRARMAARRAAKGAAH